MRLAALLVAMALAAPAFAVTPDEILPNPQHETRARALSKELRCMVCQNQSIDDSDAPLARDLRILVRERISAGDSDSQVMDFLRSRYGAFVLLRPPLDAATIFLWATPVLVLLAGVGALVVGRRRQSASSRSMAEAVPLSAAEEAELAALAPDVAPRDGRPLTESVPNITKD